MTRRRTMMYILLLLLPRLLSSLSSVQNEMLVSSSLSSQPVTLLHFLSLSEADNGLETRVSEDRRFSRRRRREQRQGSDYSVQSSRQSNQYFLSSRQENPFFCLPKKKSSGQQESALICARQFIVPCFQMSKRD